MSNLDGLSEENRKTLELLVPDSPYWIAAKKFLSDTEDGQDLTDKQFDWMLQIIAQLTVETNKRVGKEVWAEPTTKQLTLTEMLVNCETHLWADQINTVKKVFKKWLFTVGLPDYDTTGKEGTKFSATKSLRKLLITLLDEP